MSKADILWPMGALALLTFCVLGLIPFRRIGASLRKEITPDDFRYGESARVSGYVSIPNRSMMNLLELPVLLYFFCLLSSLTNSVGCAFLFSSWCLVCLGVVKS